MFEEYGRLTGNKLVDVSRCLLGDGAYQNLILFLKSLDVKSFGQRRAFRQLRHNKRFYGRYFGERCFILGNGPSIRDVDLELLSGEYVFTMNFFHKIEGHEKIKPAFHVFNDGYFFDQNEKERLMPEELDDYYGWLQKIGVPCFIPCSGYDYVHSHLLDETTDFNYVYFGLPIGFAKIKDINLCKVIPSVNTVAQTAMMIAIYMGFSEIYMIGIDGTIIAVDIEERLKQGSFDGESHPYDESSMYQYREGFSMKERLMEQYNFFAGFDSLYGYAESRGIKIYNCSSRTLVDSLPQIPLREALKRNGRVCE